MASLPDAWVEDARNLQWATPNRILLFVPSMILETRYAVRLMPFSVCKLPLGTTKLELNIAPISKPRSRRIGRM